MARISARRCLSTGISVSLVLLGVSISALRLLHVSFVGLPFPKPRQQQPAVAMRYGFDTSSNNYPIPGTWPPVADVSPLNTGDQVDVKRSDGQWCRGRITAIQGDGTVSVNIEGTSLMKHLSPGRQATLLRRVDHRGTFSPISDSIPPSLPVTPDGLAQLQNGLLEALQFDLTNQFITGYTYTPFATDVEFVDPLVQSRGRIPYHLLHIPPAQLMRLLMDPDTVKFGLKSINVVAGDFDPFSVMKYAPSTTPLGSKASFAIHCVWEISAVGRWNIKGALEQKPFYMSGQDIFRVDSDGRVVRHERGWDQDPLFLLAYMNPWAHVPWVESSFPYFADAIVAKPPEPRSDADM